MTTPSSGKTIRINVIANTTQARAELRRLGAEVANLTRVTRALAAPIRINLDVRGLSSASSALGSIRSSALDLKGVLAGAFGALATGAGGNAIVEYALAADRARINSELFEMTMRRMGVSMTGASKAAKGLVAELGGTVTESKAKESLEGLIRQGFTAEQAVEAIGRATASALKFGKDANLAVEALNDVAATGLSQRLNAIGVAENISTYYKKAASEYKVSVDELTKAQRAAALLKLLQDATVSEYNQKDTLLGGVTGNLSRLRAEFDLTKQVLGRSLIGPVNTAAEGLTKILQLARQIPPDVQTAALAFTAFTVSIVGLKSLQTLLTLQVLPAVKTFGLTVAAAARNAAVALGVLPPLTAGAAAGFSLLAGTALVLAGAATIAAVAVLTVIKNMESAAAAQDAANASLAENYAQVQSIYGADVAASIRRIVVLEQVRGELRRQLTAAQAAGSQEEQAAAERRLKAVDSEIRAQRALATEARKAQITKTYFGFVDGAVQESAERIQDASAATGEWSKQAERVRRTWKGVLDNIKEADARALKASQDDGTFYDPTVAQDQRKRAEDAQRAELRDLEARAGRELATQTAQIDQEIEKGRIDRMEEGLAKRAALREYELAEIGRWAEAQRKAFDLLPGAQTTVDEQAAAKRRALREQSLADEQRYVADLIKAANAATSRAQIGALPEGAARSRLQFAQTEREIREEGVKRLAAVKGNAQAEAAINEELAARIAEARAQMERDIAEQLKARVKREQDNARAVIRARQDAELSAAEAQLAVTQQRYAQEQRLAEGNAARLAQLAARYEPVIAGQQNGVTARSTAQDLQRLQQERNDLLQQEGLTADARLAIITSYNSLMASAQLKGQTDQAAALQQGSQNVIDSQRAASQAQLDEVSAALKLATSRAALMARAAQSGQADLRAARERTRLSGEAILLAEQELRLGQEQGKSRSELIRLETEVEDARSSALDALEAEGAVYAQLGSQVGDLARSAEALRSALDSALQGSTGSRAAARLDEVGAAQRRTNAAVSDYLRALPTLQRLQQGADAAMGVSKAAREDAARAVTRLTEALGGEAGAVSALRESYQNLSDTAAGLRSYAGGVGAGGDLGLLTTVAQQTAGLYSQALEAARERARSGQLELRDVESLAAARRAADDAEAARIGELNRADQQRINDLRFAIAGLPQGAQDSVTAIYQQQVADLERGIQARSRLIEQQQRDRLAGEREIAAAALTVASTTQGQADSLSAQLQDMAARLTQLGSEIPRAAISSLDAVSDALGARSAEWARIISQNLEGAISGALSRDLGSVQGRLSVTPQVVTVTNRFRIEAQGVEQELNDADALQLARRLLNLVQRDQQLGGQ